jgi:hypothetical protein
MPKESLGSNLISFAGAGWRAQAVPCGDVRIVRIAQTILSPQLEAPGHFCLLIERLLDLRELLEKKV